VHSQVSATPDTELSAQPFLRWAGSKRWLASHIAELVPPTVGTYFEPFLGSGAVYFALPNGTASNLADTLGSLVNCYSHVQQDPKQVAAIASEWGSDSASFYAVRALRPHADSIEKAAQFIYLNRFCFNGLYRENSRGEFNVPFGRPKNANMITPEELSAASRRLNHRTTLSTGDFAETLAACQTGDFVYLDPPYVAGHRNNGFVDYNARIFSWYDQQRLSEEFHRLTRLGVHVVVSNADHPSVRELYEGHSVKSVSRHSSMAASVAARGQSREILVTSAGLEWRTRG
jgi:DNA adenine methylase